MKITWRILIALSLLMVGATSVWAKPPKSLELDLQTDATFRINAQKSIQAIEQTIRRQAQRSHIKVDEKTIKKNARKKYAESLTLEQFVDALTPASRKWFATYFDKRRKKGEDDFSTFFAKNKKKRIGELSKLLAAQRPAFERSRTAQPALQVLAACAPTDAPKMTGILDGYGDSASKLIRKSTYACQKRHLVATPDQSLFLRGRNDQDQSPYFPDYPNTYCDQCCGPAAGQSILEWFNVPVKNSSGSVLTTTSSIQKRLADLMETEDGIDYTDPDDLARTLKRSEFLGPKGYCYKDGGGTLADVDFMLSAGTPVIMLIAEDSWAHYITVYGYDTVRDKYSVANDEEYSRERLRGLFSFEDTSWEADVAYGLTNTNSNTLFSYSDYGCGMPWDYAIEHPGVDAFASVDWDDLYFERFINTYVDGQNERNSRLNFYGFHGVKIDFATFSMTRTTYVSSSGQLVPLRIGNEHVITQAGPLEGLIPNNSVGTAMSIEVKVDRQFLDRFPEVHGGFVVRNAAGNVVLDQYGLFSTHIDTASSSADPQNYVFKLSRPYLSGHRSVDFQIHGGLRKLTWTLAGCWNDVDGDLVCDEHDPDIDNDGVQNAADNCPYKANPGQESTLNPPLGDACWKDSLGPLTDWGKGVLPDIRGIMAVERIMDRIQRAPSDPCQCRGLCFSCPAQFAVVESVLKEYAKAHSTGKVSTRDFSNRVTSFLNDFQFTSVGIDVQESRLEIAQAKNSIKMKVVAPTPGRITIKVPTVVLDKKSMFLQRVEDLSVFVDGTVPASRQLRTSEFRTITFRVPRGAREIELVGNKSGFQ